MSRRFAQLTYTSYDNGSGRGGWQVKDVSGMPTHAEQETLVNRVVTSFDLEPRLPDFPSGDDLASRPARLARERLPDGSSAMWHTVEAGRDGSGRPGNVFAHVVLDRGTPEPGEHRPIALWRSSGWLRPYGPDVVAASSLPADIPPPNPAIDTSSAIRFVIASMERQAVFRVLMDAVLARLDGGPAVVLRADDHDQAVDWISAVSHFLPQSIAHRLSWSTHDRLERAVLDVANGVDLIAVPASEVLDGGVSGAVVLSPDDSGGLAMPGGEHRVSGGVVPATQVSSLLEGVLFDPSIASEVLRSQDEVDGRFHAESPSASWLLAVGFSVVLTEMDDPDMVEFAREAEKVIGSEFPPSAMDDPHTGPLITEALRRNPMTAQACLGLLQRAHDAGRPTADLADAFLTTALGDGSWRTTPLASIPKIHAVDIDSVRDGLTGTIDKLAPELTADPAGGTPSVLILVEIARRLILERQLAALLDLFRPISASLSISGFGGGSWPANTSVYEVNSAIYAELLRPRLAAAPSVRRTVPAPYWELFSVPVPGPNRPLLPPEPTREDLAVLPFAGLTFLQANNLVGPVAVREDVARDAIDAALAAPREYLSDPDCQDLTRDILAAVPTVGVELSRWTAQAPGRIAGDLLHRAVFYDPADIGLLQTLADPRQGGTPADVAAAAALRLMIAGYVPLPDRTELFRLVTAALTLASTSNSPFAPDVAEFLDAVLLVKRATDEPWSRAYDEITRRLYAQNTGRESNVAAHLTRLVDGKVISPEWTAARAFLGAFDAERANTQPDGDAEIARRALDQLRRTYPGPRNTDELRDACWPILVRRPAADAEAFFAGYKRAGTDWLRSTIPEADVHQRRMNRS